MGKDRREKRDRNCDLEDGELMAACWLAAHLCFLYKVVGLQAPLSTSSISHNGLPRRWPEGPGPLFRMKGKRERGGGGSVRESKRINRRDLVYLCFGVADYQMF